MKVGDHIQIRRDQSDEYLTTTGFTRDSLALVLSVGQYYAGVLLLDLMRTRYITKERWEVVP